MASQGLFVKTVGGKVVLKIVAGCNGYNINKVMARIQQDKTLQDPAQVFKATLEEGVGCPDCLVVQTPEDDYCDGADDLSPLYREKFHEPQFNPRLESGHAEWFASIHLPTVV